MAKKVKGMRTIKKIIKEFAIQRITTAVDKKLIKNGRYKDLQQRQCDFENQIPELLTDENKIIFNRYGDLITEILCIREEFAYMRGMTDAFRIKDILLKAIE